MQITVVQFLVLLWLTLLMASSLWVMVLNFEFVLKKGKNKTELVIDNSGKVTKKEQLKEENENDEKEEKEGK